MSDFRELEVWKLAKNLAVDIYKISNKSNFYKDFGLREQIRRAAVSISSNISEGEESGSIKSSMRYLNIAKASNAEVKSQAIIAHEVGYINKEEANSIINTCENISKKLYFLIMYRRKSISK